MADGLVVDSVLRNPPEAEACQWRRCSVLWGELTVKRLRDIGRQFKMGARLVSIMCASRAQEDLVFLPDQIEAAAAANPDSELLNCDYGMPLKKQFRLGFGEAGRKSRNSPSAAGPEGALKIFRRSALVMYRRIHRGASYLMRGPPGLSKFL